MKVRVIPPDCIEMVSSPTLCGGVWHISWMGMRLIFELFECVEDCFVTGMLAEQALKIMALKIIVKEIDIPIKATNRRFCGEG